MAGGAVAQRIEWSTYDFAASTNPMTGQTNVVGGGERWADVKTPGDGRTYAAGTANASITEPAWQPLFSGEAISSVPGVAVSNTGGRQVGVVQVTDEPGNILWQRYIHGDTVGQLNGLSTTVRGIAVLPAEENSAGEYLATRVVVYGDTFDDVLPASVTSRRINQQTQIPLNEPLGGFVAVFNGEGTILWSYRFHGRDLNAETTIADVVIHREESANGPIDVITYCGNSNNGVFDGIDPLTNPISTIAPLLPHPAPASWPGGFPTAGDFHDSSAGTGSPSSTWDGFVGRLSMPSNGPYTAATRVFHSIVGGGFDDTLWGIAQRDENRFAVVGVTDIQVLTPGTVTDVPLTRPLAFNSATPVNFHGGGWSSFGTVFEFDALPTRTGSNLSLVGSTLIGSLDETTVARDVRWDDERMWVVGSTDDPSFATGFPNSIGTVLNGSFDGFVASTIDPDSGFSHASLLGAPGEDALVGISGWNEYPDHFAVVGWREDMSVTTTPRPRDFYVASVFHDTTTPLRALRIIRESTFGSSADDAPANLQSLATIRYFGYAVGDPAGGGVAMDPRGKVTVVGGSWGSNYPVEPAPAPVPPTTRPYSGGALDAVLTRFDMLPTGVAPFGVCRTDGSGICPGSGWSPGPSYAGDGGTTPACAVASFGRLAGAPVPELLRGFVDIEGTVAPGQSVAILYDRPAANSSVQGSLMTIGFPSSLPDPTTLALYGIESWMPAGSVSQLYFTTGQSLRVPLGVLPSGANVFSIQFTSLLNTGQTLCGNPNYAYTASPGLIFGY